MDYTFATAFGAVQDSLAGIAITAAVCFAIFLLVMAALRDR